MKSNHYKSRAVFLVILHVSFSLNVRSTYSIEPVYWLQLTGILNGMSQFMGIDPTHPNVNQYNTAAIQGGWRVLGLWNNPLIRHTDHDSLPFI